jgi:ABC-2 type transport system permease protein
MNPILLIAKKDLRSYFYSPIAYVVIAMFLLIVGWMFSNLFSYYAQSLQQFATFSSGPKPTLTENLLRPLIGNINVVLLFVAPFITMRLLAEETKDHTIELLLTAPVRPIHIVLGKFLAGVGIVMVMVLLTTVYPLILHFAANPDWGAVLGCYVGMFFVASTYVAVGLFWSSRTENQIVAAVLSFGTLLFFWLISWSAHRAGPVWSDVLEHLSLIGHFSNFSMGVIDTVDIVFYLSFTGFALFLTNLSVDSRA